MSTKRIVWIDVAKYICIICVIIQHLESATDELRVLYTPFFLNLFLFCAGYVYKNSSKLSTLFRKKIKELLIPWFIFSTINLLLSAVMSFNSHSSFLSEFGWNLLQIRRQGDRLWFIAALFIAFIPFSAFFVFYKKHTNRNPRNIPASKKSQSNFSWGPIIIISCVLSLLSNVYTEYMNPEVFPWKSTSLPWHLEYMFQAVFFMVLGYYFRNSLEEKFDQWNNWKNRLITWSVYLVVIFFSYKLDDQFSLPVKILMRYITAFIGIVSIIMLCKLIKPGRYMLFIGRNTLLCFALHGKIISITEEAINQYANNVYTTILSNPLFSSAFSILFALLISIILLLPIYIIEKYLPFLIGRKR